MSETENKNQEEKKEIEIVTGNIKDLDISPVTNYIKIEKCQKKSDKKTDIVIPKNKSEKK